MSELSTEAQRVIVVVEEIAHLMRDISEFALERSDTRDGDWAETLDERIRERQNTENGFVNDLKAIGVTIEYDGGVTTVFKLRRKWLVFGVWQEFAMEERISPAQATINFWARDQKGESKRAS